MKAKLNLRFSMALLPMLMLLNSYAQRDFTNVSAYRYSSNQSSGVAFRSPGNNLETNGVVIKKVLKHFNRTFRNAESIKWEQLDDNFLASFVKDDITTKSLFDKNGNSIYTINYYSEQQLPIYIKYQVANNYRKYAITSAARILQDDRTIWIVKLANKKNYTAVKIENDEIEEVENFQKAN